MSAYFGLLLSVGVAAAVGGAILYDGERTSSSRAAISLILLFAAIAPAVDLISDISLSPPRLPEIPEVGCGEYAEVAEEAFCRGIASLLADKYSLPDGDFGVKCRGFDFYSMRAESLTVTLRGAAVFCDPRAVEKFINSYEIGECYAEIGV